MQITLCGMLHRTVTLEGDRVTIRQERHLLAGKWVKTLPISSLGSVEVRKDGRGGYIRFRHAGDVFSFTTALWPNTDDNAVIFIGAEAYEKALAIADYIRNYQKSADTAAVVAAPSAADEILKLKGLLDQGILTQEEFSAKKRQLLGI
jgi:hypothetical protein